MDSLDFSFNTIDIFIVLPLLWFGYKGLRNGLIIEAASLIALIIGVYGAFFFSGITAEFLIKNLNLETDYVGIIAFALTFIAIVIVIHILARFLKKIVAAISLGVIDKIFGLIFSLAKWAFILSVLLGIINPAFLKFCKSSSTPDDPVVVSKSPTTAELIPAFKASS